MVLDWAFSLGEGDVPVRIAVNEMTRPLAEEALAGRKNVSLCLKPEWNTRLLLEEMHSFAKASGAQCAVYSSADRPFLSAALTKEVLAAHSEYVAEYTFADGYPLGFAPEVIDCGTLGILCNLASDTFARAGEAPVSSTCIFDVMKGDVNSFEVETVLAPTDWRMYRLDFSCSTLEKTLSCRNLFETAVSRGIEMEVLPLTELAVKTACVQQTVPFYYNVQITPFVASEAVYSPYCSCFSRLYGTDPLYEENKKLSAREMPLEDFTKLAEAIAKFSETAVVGLSAWGDPLLVKNLDLYVKAVLEHPGLSVLIETDGLTLDAAVAQKIASIANAAPKGLRTQPPVTWIVGVDAVTDKTYMQIHRRCCVPLENAHALALKCVETLSGLFPGNVYPQLVRMNVNENELESFYRFWHDANSPSQGKLIIQKYDSFCGMQADCKPADLTPVNRNPCWHLKRDMTILCDGSVPFCRERVLDAKAGNVFTQGIEEVWKGFAPLLEDHICGKYSEKCGACDEYYTFNF